jgi:glycosyltransferase involved in cell wall biosynthesis
VAELVKRFSGITFSFTAHAKDIYLSRKQELARKIQAAEFVLTCTGYNQKYLQDIYAGPTPIYLAYHGIDLSKFNNLDRAPHPAEPPLILSVGRFCDKKGFPYLIEACRVLKARGCTFRCSIVGWGPLRDDLERMIVELNLSDCVSLVNEMTQDQLVHLYMTAGMFVLPCILTDNGDRDGIPNVLIEAMAMRVPVISTEVSGIPELVEHMENGILVPEKNSTALADAIELLLSHPDLRSRFAEKGRAKVVKQFTLENNVRIVQTLLKGVAEGRPAAAQEKGEITAHVGMR